MASGGAVHRVYPHTSQQAFLKAHELAVQYFGGVFAVLRFGNLKSAVQKFCVATGGKKQQRFIAFRSHCGFQSEFCTPGRANEKGGVEEEGGHSRRNYLVPLPRAPELEHLNELLLASCQADEGRTITGRERTIGSGMAIKREYLRSLPAESFDLAAISFPKVDGSGTVPVLKNFYSAPLSPGARLQAKCKRRMSRSGTKASAWRATKQR